VPAGERSIRGTIVPVITRGLREFVARDWQAARDHKDAYWADRIARLGPREGLRIADELRRQAILRDPAWPDAALRKADLLAHARLSGSLRRADSARRA
jgi:hypothetical protein